MLLLYCDTRGEDEKKAVCPPRSGRTGSAFGASLLALAARRYFGMEGLPEITEDSRGKPFFSGFPQAHFSLSHSRGHVLCAVSDAPVGVDIEFHRPLRAGTADKLMSQEEMRDFDFFELWTLRESFYKLTGEGSLKSTRFRLENGRPVAPKEGVFCRLYGGIEGVSAAMCSCSNKLPETLEIVLVSQLIV